MNRASALNCFLGLFLIFSSPIYAGEVRIQDTDYPKLIGIWKGELEIKPAGGKEGSGRFEAYNLKIMEDNIGQFTKIKTGKKWKTPVKIKDGKVLMKYAKEERAFTYAEQSENFTLSIEFEIKQEGKKWKQKFILKK